MLAPERMRNTKNVIDDLKNYESDSWSKKKQWKKQKLVRKKKEKNRKKKKKQAEKANSP